MGQLPRCPICDSSKNVENTSSAFRYYCSDCDESFDLEESPDAPRVEITTTYYPDTSEKTVTLGDFHALRQQLDTYQHAIKAIIAKRSEEISKKQSEFEQLQQLLNTVTSMLREEISSKQSQLEQLEQLLNTGQTA